jgi:hypothetical protein
MEVEQIKQALTGLKVVIDYPGDFLVKTSIFAGIAAVGVFATIAIGIANLADSTQFNKRLSKLEKKAGA